MVWTINRTHPNTFRFKPPMHTLHISFTFECGLQFWTPDCFIIEQLKPIQLSNSKSFAHADADAKFRKSMQISAQLCGFGCGFLHFTVLFRIVPYVFESVSTYFCIFCGFSCRFQHQDADFNADFSSQLRIETMTKSAFFCKCGCGLPQISVSLCRMRNLKKFRTYLVDNSAKLVVNNKLRTTKKWCSIQKLDILLGFQMFQPFEYRIINFPVLKLIRVKSVWYSDGYCTSHWVFWSCWSLGLVNQRFIFRAKSESLNLRAKLYGRTQFGVNQLFCSGLGDGYWG